jgi:hypothetical protein
VEPVTARKMWRTLEPIHGMIYFAPEAAAAYAAIGLDDYRAGYFASRSAPMGAVTAEVVIATFFNFNPSLVRNAVPACWEKVTPAAMVDARVSAADAALRRVLGDRVTAPDIARAADLARRAASAPVSPAGRPLYAGHTSVAWPEEPHLVLWHALSLLREYRGDGHIAALVGAGVDPVEALVIHAGTGEVPRAALQSTRAWDDAAWDAASAALQSRGWIAADGTLTEAGRAHRLHVEELTDELALAPWAYLGDDGCAELRELGRPWSKAIVGASTFGTPPS